MAFSILEKLETAFTPTTRPKATPADFPNGFIIKEMVESDFMLIALIGNSMPHIPFEWGGELRMNETYYPGNPEPTVQVYGSKEEPLTIKGRLFDKRQDKPLAADVTDVIDTIRKRGNMVELRLGAWVRYGYLSKCIFRMRRLTSIEYELTFFIISDKEPVQNPILAGKALPAANNEKLKDVQSRLVNNVAEYPTDFPKGPFDQISADLNTIMQKVSVVTGAVDKLLTLAEDTSRGINKVVALVASAKTAVFRVNQRIGALQLNTMVMAKSLDSSFNYSGITKAYPTVPKQNVTTGFKNVAQVQKTQAIVTDMQKVLGDLSSDLGAFLRTSILRRHLVKDGETLQTIAVKYYSDAEKWTNIRDHNKLKSPEIAAGKVLEIPK